MSSQMASSDPVEVKVAQLDVQQSATAPGTLGIYTDGPATTEGYAGQFPDLHVWCTRLGMLPNVVEDWSTWHVDPATAMIWFFTAQYAFPFKTYIVGTYVLVASLQRVYMRPKCCRIMNYAVSIVLFLGAPITRYLYTVPYMVTLPLQLAYTAAFWRWGPMSSHSKLFRITLPVAVIGFLTPHIVGFAGPVEHAPFGSQLIFTVLLAPWVFTR
jgi:hypothetical protein